MKYRCARVTITGYVFVPEFEVNDALGVDVDNDDTLNYTTEQEREAFDKLAREAIAELIPSDDPVKVQEVDIDLSTLK